MTQPSKKKQCRRKLIHTPIQHCTLFDDVKQRLPNGLTFETAEFACDGLRYLEIFRSWDIPPAMGGPLPGAKIVISEMGTVFFQPTAGKREFLDDNLLMSIDSVDYCIEKLGHGWGRCFGIPADKYKRGNTKSKIYPRHFARG